MPEISYKLDWYETKEGWELYGRALNKAKRIVASVKFHLPYETADSVDSILGGSSKVHAQKVIEELLQEMVQRLRDNDRL